MDDYPRWIDRVFFRCYTTRGMRFHNKYPQGLLKAYQREFIAMLQPLQILFAVKPRKIFSVNERPLVKDVQNTGPVFIPTRERIKPGRTNDASTRFCDRRISPNRFLYPAAAEEQAADEIILFIIQVWLSEFRWMSVMDQALVLADGTCLMIGFLLQPPAG